MAATEYDPMRLATVLGAALKHQSIYSLDQRDAAELLAVLSDPYPTLSVPVGGDEYEAMRAEPNFICFCALVLKSLRQLAEEGQPVIYCDHDIAGGILALRNPETRELADELLRKEEE